MVAATGGSDLVRFEVRPQGFQELQTASAQFDDAVERALRTNLHGVAVTVVRDIRTAVMGGSYSTDAGMRQGISDGIQVQYITGKARPGVSIIASDSKMPTGKALMVKAWQKQTFKHPAFGDRAVLVEQDGRPYFDETITRDRAKATNAVTAAMKQAADTLRSRA